MPFYTYRCTNCGHQLDVKQRVGEDAPNPCPNCAESALGRVYKPVGVVFKGSGFYATDNRSASRVSNGANGKSESSGEGSSEKSSDGKDSKDSKSSDSSSSSGSESSTPKAESKSDS
jgi:putative FmdB family regulatory protein